MKKLVALLLALSMVFALCGCGKKDAISNELAHNYYKSSWQVFGNSYTVVYHFGENGAAEKYWECVYGGNGHTETMIGYGFYTVTDDKIVVSYKNDPDEDTFSESELTYKQDNSGRITLYDNLDRAYKQQ